MQNKIKTQKGRNSYVNTVDHLTVTIRNKGKK